MASSIIASKIRETNDKFRVEAKGKEVYISDGIVALGFNMKSKILEQLRSFSAFPPENEGIDCHNSGHFEIYGADVTWTIVTMGGYTQSKSAEAVGAPSQSRMLLIRLSSEA